MNSLREGHKYFQQNIFPKNRNLFEQLKKGQYPESLFITCSDSRICPNLITGQGPGDLFVLRNAGNLIPVYRQGEITTEGITIEYAIKGLKVKNVVVCGHSHCGAMQGVLNRNELDHLPLVQQKLNHLYRDYQEFLKNGEELIYEEKVQRLIRFNVLHQLRNLLSYPFIMDAYEKKEIQINGWVYHFESGDIEELALDTKLFNGLRLI